MARRPSALDPTTTVPDDANFMLDSPTRGTYRITKDDFSDFVRGELDLSAMQEIRDATQLARNSADASASAAKAARDKAASWAMMQPDVEVETGEYSALHWAVQADKIAAGSRAVITRDLTDADFTSGVYVLKSTDLFKQINLKNTTAASIRCPVNLWTDTSGEAWIDFRREGAQVTFINETGAAVGAPSIVGNPLFGAVRTRDVAASVPLAATLACPTITSGRLLIIGAGTYNQTTNQGASLTTSRGTFSSILTDTNLVANECKFDAWEASVAAFAAGDLTLNFTLAQNCNSFIFFLIPLEGASTRVTPTFVRATNSLVSHTFATNAANQRVIALAAQRNFGAHPVNLSSNLTRLAHGDTVGIPTGYDTAEFRNMSYGLGTMVQASAASLALNAQFQKSSKSGMLALAYSGSASGPTSSVLNSAGGRVSLAESYQRGTLNLRPDGATYFLEIGKVA